MDWFLKTLLPPIAKDVTSERPQSKEEAILKAQQFDLIYAQSGCLYTVILDTPRPGTSYRDALVLQREIPMAWGTTTDS